MPTNEAAKTLILNAAQACYLRLGVSKTTASDIAEEAGISRATLYRRFPSHGDIFLAVLGRESLEMATVCENKLKHISDPAEHVIEGILCVLDEIVRRPLHSHLFTDSGGPWVLSQTMAAENLHEMCFQMLLAAPEMPKNPDPEARTQLAYLAEWILRILASYAITPSHMARSRDDMRVLLQTTLEPAIRAVLTRHSAGRPGAVAKG